jgi:CubicO group peptidase (beta-lactamase class C family)
VRLIAGNNWFQFNSAESRSSRKSESLDSKYRGRSLPGGGRSMLRYIFGVVLLVATGFAQDPSRMDKAVQAVVANKNFMGSVLVARGDQVLFSRSYGWANMEWEVPNTPTTKFRIGSLTKQFTAAAILLLEERGRLKIEDPIRKYLPDEPAAWDKVTIYHLLTHTSGIVNHLSLPEVTKMVPFPQTPDQLMALVRDKPLEFVPGEKMRYSNSGYNLLGCLIEKLTGQRYQDFIQKNIFTPLGMKDSGYDSNSDIIPRRAAGYSPGPGGPVNAEFVHMSNTYSAGGLYSTTEDLLRWEQGLFGGKLLSPESLRKMTTPYLNGYAFGLGADAVHGRKRISHEGGVPGFNSCLAYYPESQVTVVALSNMFRPEIAPEIVGLLSALAHGEKITLTSELKAVPLAQKALERYVGSYQLGPGSKARICLENGKLVYRTGQLMGYIASTPLSASSETFFYSTEANFQLEFIKDAKGNVTDLVMHSIGSDDARAPRISENASTMRRDSVPVEILKQYAGVYKLPPGFDLVFTLEGNELTVHRTWQFLRYKISGESETKFLLKELDETIEFVKDANGVVTGLILREGSSEIKAPRFIEITEFDGAWTGTMKGPDGKTVELIYILKAEGQSLTGTMVSRLGEEWISGGKIDGHNFSFTINTGTSTIKTTGVLSGDSIKISRIIGNEAGSFIIRRIR